MSQIGRNVKNLEAPRPLKSSGSSSSLRQSHHAAPVFEVQTIEDLIQLTESMAATLAAGQNNSDTMNILLANLRIHGPQLELVSKDTLDRTFVVFRNASQDERLPIIVRLNLLELIELRAKSWQNSDGINTYYKHKANYVEPDTNASVSSISEQLSMLSTSPPSNNAIITAALGQNILGPGEVIKNSGKFAKPTKIPGKNYSKDEIVIRNADSGKVMGIKGRRVHMIEELSETIISFQRVSLGAKERLVQITGPNEDKINYAKQLIGDTIRRNASPVRLEATQGGGGNGSCSSLASSASDEAIPRNQAAAANAMANNNRNSIGAMIQQQNSFIQPGHPVTAGGGKMTRNSTGQMLLHSFSTNDATLGEYKFTVNVGQHNIKITGDCFELVRTAKLVLDDYFSSNEFLASFEAGAAGIDQTGQPTTPLTAHAPTLVPASHQLASSGSQFVDSGIGLNILAASAGGISSNNNNSPDADDDVFVGAENYNKFNDQSSTSITSTPLNGLARSRRSHFSRKDSTPESNDRESKEPMIRIEYERLLSYAKSPHSQALPHDWEVILQKYPSVIRPKDNDDEKTYFDADKHLALSRAKALNMHCTDEPLSESPDPE